MERLETKKLNELKKVCRFHVDSERRLGKEGQVTSSEAPTNEVK